MKYSAIILSVLTVLLLSCTKEPSLLSNADPTTGNFPKSAANPPLSKSILVDASKDGGVWWFPQSSATGFSFSNDHQGKNLADYLRSLGYQVDELPRGTTITTEVLNKYENVIRAAAFGSYSAAEMAAYKSFLSGNKSLFLIQDHLANSANDQLSVELGLAFEGSYTGTLNSFSQHAVTVGATPLPYIAGSVIFNHDPAKITALATLTANGTNAVAMGIVKHPTSRIFFIGDLNGIEAIPQPLTSNLISWLFR